MSAVYKPPGSTPERELRPEEEQIQQTTMEDLRIDERPEMLMILSTHVDDLKGGATRKVAEDLLKHLERHVGTCKAEWDVLHTSE